MTVSKFTNQPTIKEVTEKVNDVIDNIPTLTGYLQNTATGSSSLTLLGTATTTTGSTNVGVGTQCTANYATVIGHNAKGGASSCTAIGRSTNASGSYAVALGYGATCSGGKSIQLGYGTNSTANTLYVGFQGGSNYLMLDGATGLIPSARIPIDNSTITVNSSGQLQSAGGSGGANTDLSNLSATGQKVIDGQWTWKNLEVATNTSSGSYEHNLSSYLPNDTYSYEIFLRIGCYYNSANAGFAVGTVASPNTNKTSSGNYFVYQYVTTNTRGGYCNAIIPVGTSRKIYSQITAALQNSTIELFGYRRIGTNT